MHLHAVGGFGFLPESGLEHFVLQTGGCHFDRGSLGVLGEETFAFGFGCAGGLFLQFLEELVEHLLCFLQRDLRFTAFEHVFHAGNEVLAVDFFNARLGKILAN